MRRVAWAEPDVSIYSELLRLVLDREGDSTSRPLGALVSDALSRRAGLTPAGGRARAADRIGDSLAYDAALVRLCGRLGLAQELTGEGDGMAARVGAERHLADRLPSVAAAFRHPPPGEIQTGTQSRGPTGGHDGDDPPSGQQNGARDGIA